MKQSVPLIVGNWKLNPLAEKDANALVTALKKSVKKQPEPYVAVAPPFVYLAEIGKKVEKSPITLGAQDVSQMPVGAFTGEISAAQLKNLGVEFVIIGHSERRAMGETDEQVVKKVQQALKYRLTPIVCIGEKERDENGQFFTVIETQLQALAQALSASEMKKLVIAYEPIWAIGTGNTATVDDVKEMQLFIASTLTKLFDRALAKKVRLLYGGSVKPHNAFALQQGGGMQGFLVGGASLKAKDFMEIIHHAHNASQ